MPQMGVDGTTGDVIVTYGNGVTSQFTANMDGSFTSPPTDLGTLRSSGGGFTYTSFNGDVEQFNSSGQLTNTTNPNGVGTTYTYNGGGNLGGVQYPDGRTYTFAYNGDYIKTITGPGGTVTTLTYDGGNLVGVTQSDGVGLSFEYDVDNNLTNISQGDDSIWIVYDDNEIPYQVYDSAESTHPYVVKTLVSEAMTPYDNNVATITDPFGNITTYAMDNSGHPTQTTYPDGSTRSSQYNSADQVTETVDQLGTTTSYDYDGSGDVSRVTVSDPSVTTYTYDPTYHKVATKTDPDGRVTTFVYDSTGDLVSQTNALGTTTYTWSTGAPVTSATPPALANPGTQVNDVGDGVALCSWRPRTRLERRWSIRSPAYPPACTKQHRPHLWDGDHIYFRYGDGLGHGWGQHGSANLPLDGRLGAQHHPQPIHHYPRGNQRRGRCSGNVQCDCRRRRQFSDHGL